MRRRDKVSALSIVRGYGLWIERVDRRVIRILRVERYRCGESLVGCRIPVELSVRVDLLYDTNVIGAGNRIRVERVIPITHRLKQVELPLLERPSESQMRRRTLHPVRMPANPSEPRHWVFKQKFPLIGSAARVDFDNAAGKASILCRKRI